jgi:hypothetical protein
MGIQSQLEKTTTKFKRVYALGRNLGKTQSRPLDRRASYAIYDFVGELLARPHLKDK